MTGRDFTMDTLGHGEALLREQRLEQQRMLLDEARVPPEIVQDAEILEKSLSALRGKQCALHKPGLAHPAPKKPWAGLR